MNEFFLFGSGGQTLTTCTMTNYCIVLNDFIHYSKYYITCICYLAKLISKL